MSNTHTEGKIKSFKYHNRSVKIKVINEDNHCIVGELLTEYKGKNETWEVGELKAFSKSLIKKPKKQNAK